MTYRGTSGEGLPLPKPGRGVQLTVLAATLCLLAVASPAGADTPSDDLGTIQWPAEEHRDFAVLADLGASVYANGTEPTKLGLNQFEGMRLERVNASATRIIVEEAEGRTTSILQPHRPREAGGREDVDVRPAQLRPVVETHLDEERHSIYVLKMWGPPGSFDLGNGSAEERTRALANRLGFPIEGVTEGDSGASFPYLYGGHHRGCYEASGGDCVSDADIRIDCDACREFSWGGPQKPSSALDSRFQGLGFALFDEQDRLVATSVSYVFDLNESAILDPSMARSEAADDLRDRGHGLDEEAPDWEARLGTRLAPDAVEVERVEYTWGFHVVRGNPSDPN